MRQVSPFKLPLVQALARGSVGIYDVPRGALCPADISEDRGKPIIACFGDDDYQATGPAGFPAAKRFSYWAKAAIVHATGGEAAHYQHVVDAALFCGRLLFIETDFVHAAAWQHFLGDGKRIPILMILPPNGVHPAPAKSGELQ